MIVEEVKSKYGKLKSRKFGLGMALLLQLASSHKVDYNDLWYQ